MAIDVTGVFASVESHLRDGGLFDQVGMHEPKSGPGTGMAAVAWVSRLRALALVSGLSSVSVRLELSIRVYKNMLSQPQDDIDTEVLQAVDALLNDFAGDFELGGEVMHVDLLGAYGDSLAAEAGYLEQDGKLYRVMVITLPLILADVWTEVA